MSLAATELWDPQQREWLQAMGHSLLVLAGDEAVPVVAEREDVAEAAAVLGSGRVREADSGDRPAATAGQTPTPTPTPRVRRPAPPSLPESPSATPAPVRPRTDPAAKLAALEAAAQEAGAVRNFSGPLGEALLRATGQPPAAATRMLRELAVDPATLRDDPAAKRALWKRLRSLRRGAQ